MSNFKSLYEIKISEHIDDEYIPYFEDLVRMVTLQIVLQFMYYIRDPEHNSFMTLDFFELLMYIILGVSVYWLLFKKVIRLS
jgi:hypothetical protein